MPLLMPTALAQPRWLQPLTFILADLGSSIGGAWQLQNSHLTQTKIHSLLCLLFTAFFAKENTVEFQTTTEQACYDQIAVWMKELFGQFPCARSDFPGLGLFMNSALVEVLIYPWGNHDAVINTRSFVVRDANLTQN